MGVSVAEIRAELSAAQNKKYRDYQIQWWIEHKKGNKADILKTIANQPTNEKRALEILSDRQRWQTTFSEMNRGVLYVIHAPEIHKVIVFVYTKNKAKNFVEQEVTDSMLLFLYYLQNFLETKEGDGAQAVMLIDMSGPSPSIAELKSQVGMFSGIIGRTFPKIFEELVCCWDISGFFRASVNALARTAGLNATFISPKDAVARFGPKYVPDVIGGNLSLSSLEKAGDMVQKFFSSGANGRTFTKEELSGIVCAPSILGNLMGTIAKSFRKVSGTGGPGIGGAAQLPPLIQTSSGTYGEPNSGGTLSKTKSGRSFYQRPGTTVRIASTATTSANEPFAFDGIPFVEEEGECGHSPSHRRTSVAVSSSSSYPPASGGSATMDSGATMPFSLAQWLMVTVFGALLAALVSGSYLVILTLGAALGGGYYLCPALADVAMKSISGGGDGGGGGGSAGVGGGDPSAGERVARNLCHAVLEETLSETASALAPLNLTPDNLADGPQLQNPSYVQNMSVAFAAKLAPSDKSRLENCLRRGNRVLETYRRSPCALDDGLRSWAARWTKVANWLTAVLNNPSGVSCPCGACAGRHYRLDDLMRHLNQDSQARIRVLQKLPQYVSPSGGATSGALLPPAEFLPAQHSPSSNPNRSIYHPPSTAADASASIARMASVRFQPGGGGASPNPPPPLPSLSMARSFRLQPGGGGPGAMLSLTNPAASFRRRSSTAVPVSPSVRFAPPPPGAAPDNLPSLHPAATFRQSQDLNGYTFGAAPPPSTHHRFLNHVQGMFHHPHHHDAGRPISM